jgi:hypothetical protein
MRLSPAVAGQPAPFSFLLSLSSNSDSYDVDNLAACLVSLIILALRNTWMLTYVPAVRVTAVPRARAPLVFIRDRSVSQPVAASACRHTVPRAARTALGMVDRKLIGKKKQRML